MLKAIRSSPVEEVARGPQPVLGLGPYTPHKLGCGG